MLATQNRRTSAPMLYNGFRLHDGRRAGFCVGPQPRCVVEERPHVLRPRDLIISDTITTCQHRPDSRHAPCGVRLYVARLAFGGSPRIDGSGELTWIVVEVTDDFVREMHQRPMQSFGEKLELLRCVLPGLEINLPVQREQQEPTR
jgi:hypothetical protein